MKTMSVGKRFLCVRNLHTLSGRGTGLIAERTGTDYVICHIGSLSGKTFGADAQIVDGEGGVLVPAFVDLHGFPDRERTAPALREASARAAENGYAAIADADPPVGAQRLESRDKRAASARCRLLPIAPLPDSPEEVGALASRGVCGLTDGISPIADTPRLASLMASARECSLPLLLSPLYPLWQGMLRPGRAASYYRVPSVPATAEELAIGRLLILARDAGCRLHIPCISTAGGVDLIRRAKKEGLDVTCGVTPFHLALTEEDLFWSGTASKMSPPLGTEDDRDALLRAVGDGTIDCISTGHVGCRSWEKRCSMSEAVFGAPAYRTALGVCLTRLVETGIITLPRLIAMMSENPAKVIGLKTSLAEGNAAEFTVISTGREWVVGENRREEELLSPFSGQTLRGAVLHSFIGGEWR